MISAGFFDNLYPIGMRDENMYYMYTLVVAAYTCDHVALNANDVFMIFITSDSCHCRGSNI